MDAKAKKKLWKTNFYLLDLREWTRHCQSSDWNLHRCKSKKIEKKKFHVLFMYLTLENGLDIDNFRVKSPWKKSATERMSTGEQANEWAVRADKRVDKRMTKYSSRWFHIISTQCASIWDFFVSVVEEIPFFTVRGCIAFPSKPDVRKEIDDECVDLLLGSYN